LAPDWVLTTNLVLPAHWLGLHLWAPTESGADLGQAHTLRE
jgi:hypothetical protein